MAISNSMEKYWNSRASLVPSIAGTTTSSVIDYADCNVASRSKECICYEHLDNLNLHLRTLPFLYTTDNPGHQRRRDQHNSISRSHLFISHTKRFTHIWRCWTAYVQEEIADDWWVETSNSWLYEIWFFMRLWLTTSMMWFTCCNMFPCQRTMTH